jgi:hypothetical protein
MRCFEIKPDVSNLRTFGCLAYVLIPEERRCSKFEKVAETGILVGYAMYSKAWKVLVSTEVALSFENHKILNLMRVELVISCVLNCASFRMLM